MRSSYLKEFKKGLLLENPVFRLVLGTCPTLATTTTIQAALGMGVSATLVLLASNITISSLRKWIPDKVRIPSYIVLIASFVTIVQMLIKAIFPVLDEQLGIYLPLIVVNCIILGRAEAFASKHPVVVSALDGLGMGIGFTFALLSLGIFREMLGSGTFLGQAFIPQTWGIAPIGILALAPGGFFTFGLLMACANRLAEKVGLPKAELHDCASSCSSCSACGASHRCQAVNHMTEEEVKQLSIKQNAEEIPQIQFMLDENDFIPLKPRQKKMEEKRTELDIEGQELKK